jgi:hypothetical protein
MTKADDVFARAATRNRASSLASETANAARFAAEEAERRNWEAERQAAPAILIEAPSNLTALERDAWEWAVEAMESCLTDEAFLTDNEDYPTSRDAQTDDMLYRLEDQAQGMIDPGDQESVAFARAAKRAARKVRQGASR